MREVNEGRLCQAAYNTKKDMTTNFFQPLSFVAVFGSGVGRLSKATFIHISLHTYSANVVTLSKPNQVNKQQNILNLCQLLTYIIVRRVC